MTAFEKFLEVAFIVNSTKTSNGHFSGCSLENQNADILFSDAVGVIINPKSPPWEHGKAQNQYPEATKT